MAKYFYTAKNQKGEIYTATEEAPDKITLYSRVKSAGGTVLSVREKRKSSLSLPDWNFGNIGTRDKIIFAKNLSSMLSAGLSLPRALNVMEKQSKKKALAALFKDLADAINHGSALSEALSKHPEVFPPLFVSMVHAGEESGDMAGALKVISIEMDRSYQLTRRVRGAMIYPIIVVSLMITVAILMLIYMVPALTATFKDLNIELPLTTRAIIAASNFLATHTLLSLLALLLLIGAALVLSRSRSGKRVLDSIVLKLPIIGTMSREVESARTARTLSSLLSAGVPVVNALEVTASVLPNHFYKDTLDAARIGIQKGEQLSVVFNKVPHLYPPFVAEMTAVGEETGKLSEMLSEVAKFYEETVDEKTRDLSSVIEPVLMLIVGVAVGVFAVSMLLPTYSLVNTIQ